MSQLQTATILQTRSLDGWLRACSFAARINRDCSDKFFLPVKPAFLGPVRELLAFLDVAAFWVDFEDSELIAGVVSPSSHPGDVTEALLVLYEELYPEGLCRWAPRPAGRAVPTCPQGPVLLVIGARAANEALLVGLLTGRQVCLLRTIDELPAFLREFDRVESAYVFVEPDFSLTHLLRIHDLFGDMSASTPFGFHYPFGEMEREFFALKAVVFQRFGGRVRWRHTMYTLFSKQDFDVETDRFHFIAGTGLERQRLLEALTTPTESLLIETHSNGVDANLSKLVLCARIDFDGDVGTLGKAMPCYYCDECTRTSDRSALLSIHQLRSKIVVLHVCYGFLLRRAEFDVETSLLHQLARSPYCGSIITINSTIYSNVGYAARITASISAGRDLGGTVLEGDRLLPRTAAFRGKHLVLFGDPQFKLEAEALPIVTQDEPATGKVAANASANGEGAPDTRGLLVGSTAGVVIDSSQIGSSAGFHQALVERYRATLAPYPRKRHLRSLEKHASAIKCWRDVVREGRGFRRADLLNRLQRSGLRMLASVGFEHGIPPWRVMDSQLVPQDPGEVPFTQCPYCDLPLVIRREFVLHRHPHVRYAQFECLHCSVVHYGSAQLKTGEIMCEPAWEIDACYTPRLSLLVDLEGGHRFLSAIFLMPFLRDPDLEMPSACIAGQVETSGGVVRLTYPALHVPSSFSVGVHYVNAFVFLDEHIFFLRRPVRLGAVEGSARSTLGSYE